MRRPFALHRGLIWILALGFGVFGATSIASAKPATRAAAAGGAPVLARSFNLELTSGKVRFETPKSGHFVTLRGVAQVPVKTLIDATRGHVTVISAADSAGNLQQGEFWGGLFKAFQRPDGLVMAVLKGKLPSCHCDAGNTASGASYLTSLLKGDRHLWGRSHGRYGSSGHHSSATVRGTTWLVADTLFGTVTAVTDGIGVDVFDFETGQQVFVGPGGSYLAQGTVGGSFKRRASTIALDAGGEFSGNVGAKKICRGQRTVEVHNAADNSLITTTTTNADGSWAIPSTFTGQAYAAVRRRVILFSGAFNGEESSSGVICKANHSSVVSFGSAQADLALTKTAKTPPPGFSSKDATYTITVTNNGPNDAQNVVVTDTPNRINRFVPSSGTPPTSDPRCQVSGSAIVCNLGAVPANTTVSFVLVFAYDRPTQEECFSGRDINSAMVSSSTQDPNPANDTGSAETDFAGCP